MKRERLLHLSLRFALLFGSSAVLGFGSLINSYAVDPSLFDLSTFASGLSFPAGVQPLADGSVLVQTSPNYGYTPGQLLSFSSSGGGEGVVYTNGGLGLTTGSTQAGNYYASGIDTSEIGPGMGSRINLLQAGATSASPMSLVATLQLSYPTPWEHPSVGLVARPTPGVPGSYDLIINVGAQYDNVATPASSTATLTGSGFSSIPPTSLHGDSLYMITINENGAQPAVTGVQQVATGIRNVFGMTFDRAGNLWFSDNGMDLLPPGSVQPTPPAGEPPQADELNELSAAQLASGTPVNYGFPNCYIQYAWGGIPGVPVGTGCVQPVIAFQPVTDPGGLHQLIGATQVAIAPSTFPDGFNDGIFIGFTGDGGPDNNGGMAYYDFATGVYTQFIESTGVDNIIGLASTGNALFFTDAGTGNVYELTAASPEPGTCLQSVTANFQCSGRATAFLTGFGLNNPSLRHDFTGWVGAQLTVGANPLMVSALGRICVANNVTAHVVKFVNAVNGSDVPGASVSVNMAGCTPNQFAYGAITPVTLAAGATYYLVSQETYGGDQWYDDGVVSATNAATVNSAVYSYNGAWYPIGSANTSYVPPNFQYSTVTTTPITVNVGASPAGASFSVDGTTYTTAQVLTWTSGSSHTIAATTPQNVGTGTQLAWSNWSDGGAISHTFAPTGNTTYTASFTTQYLLTTSLSPAGGGSIAAGTSAAGGYYTSGTPVQLTATAATGCTFLNWNGNPALTANPLSVTMSSPQNMTADFQCSGAQSTAYLTGYALSGQPLRDDFTGWVGMKLTVGVNPLTVSSLGRICVANTALIHAVKFVNASTGSDVSGASVSVRMAGCTSGQFVYATISPVNLPAATSYYLVSQETQGGDQWYDEGAVSTTTVAAVNSAVYLYNGYWYPIGSANTSYVPPNFQYTTGGAPQYLLTTIVSPANSGTITANPSAAGGSYANGTPVQLTATAASGCTFVDWNGNSTLTVNPLSVTMSGPQTETANFQCATGSSTVFLTGYALSGQSVRNDFSGFVGMKLMVGAAPLTVSSLGRICVANNALTHTVKFVNASTGSDVSGASAPVNMVGCTAGQFVYSSISPVTLSAATSYYLVSQETQGGDQWYDEGAISSTAVAAVNSSVYFYGGNWIPVNSANTSYVPPNFQYTTGGAAQYVLTTTVSPAGGGSITANPAAAGGSYAGGTPVQLTATPATGCAFVEWNGNPTVTANPLSVTMSAAQTVTADFQCAGGPSTPFLTGYASSGRPLRNDFTGWVGMKLTVGATPLTVSFLGRICVASNGLTHTVKFVTASTGSDVSGASASVNMAGCTPGQFVYTSITPITLAAATSYYLVSQETQGGDQWYDQGGISSTTAAAVNSSVYFYNGTWYPIGSPNTSYVPPNFQ